jgi:hypothetical protein
MAAHAYTEDQLVEQPAIGTPARMKDEGRRMKAEKNER